MEKSQYVSVGVTPLNTQMVQSQQQISGFQVKLTLSSIRVKFPELPLYLL